MSDEASPVTSELMGRILREIQTEQRQQRGLLLAQVDQGRRLERRIGDLEHRITDLRDDLELMLKAELMGSVGFLRTQTGHTNDQLAARIEALEAAIKKP